MQVGRTFGLFAQISTLQDLAFNMRLQNDGVCTVPIWSMFQNGTFFITLHHATLKYFSGSLTKKSESPWLKLMSHWFVRITKHLKDHLSHHDTLKWVWLLLDSLNVSLHDLLEFFWWVIWLSLCHLNESLGLSVYQHACHMKWVIRRLRMDVKWVKIFVSAQTWMMISERS